MSAVTLFVGGVVSGLTNTSLAAGATPASGDAICVYQYAPSQGDAYFALGLRADRAKLPMTEVRTHAVLVDTSASQFGAYHQRSMEVVRGYLASLGDSDRVRLYAVDVKAVPMMAELSSAKSAACASGVDALTNRVPLGATNQLACLRSVLNELPADESAAIVYIGDGMSAARLAPPAEVGELAAEMRGRHVSVSSFAVGPQTDLEILGTFAQQTGGIVLLDKRTGTATGAELAAAAKASILYPTSLMASGQKVDLLPRTALPLRSDRETVYLGKGRAADGLRLTFDFAAQQQPIAFQVRDAAKRDANGVLSFFWQRAQTSGGVAVSLAGSQLIAAAHDTFAERIESMLNEGERAVASHDPATGEQMARTVSNLDRGNTRAASLSTAAARLRKEIASHEILRQVAPEAGSESPPPSTSPPGGPPLPSGTAAAPLSERMGPPKSDSVGKYRELMAVRGQQLSNEVTAAIAEARKAGLEDPDSAIALLKREQGVVTTAGDIEPQVRDELSRRIGNMIQELRSVKEHQQVNKLNNAERLAQVEARRKSLEQMSLEETRMTELIDQCRALLVQAVHGDDNAYEQAESVAREAINLHPGSGVATQALMNSEAGGQLNKAYRLRNLRADRFLETLYLVELAHVPFPDEPPIQWPSAQVWRALTERRKKWAQVDLRSESKSEQRISEALDQPVDFNIDPQSLKDAIDFIAARYQIPIVVDQKSLDEANVDTTTEVKGSFPGIKLRNLFKLLLEQLSAPLTYVIEDEVLKITTVDKANEKLSIRMYPVGDLIMGPQQLQALAGGGAGGAGGQRGGQGGGAGGGGLGGAGGGGLGGGGMGGGMFSVPSEPLGAARNAVPNANPSEPTHKSLRPRSPRTTDRSAARLDFEAGAVFAQADDSSPAFTNDAVRASKKKQHVAR
ncbi:MAG TPA: hypothetical protein VGP63_11220 [Planctomycetaceae bacterium]|jgi:hypothetical protein|nr:hypothetical protein [Planctomycetaceae bacterium]